MQRVIGMDIHRTFAEVVFWEAGRLRPAGRIDMTRSGICRLSLLGWSTIESKIRDHIAGILQISGEDVYSVRLADRKPLIDEPHLKTAVDAIFIGKDRLYNRRFLQMCSHYLIDPVACTPAFRGFIADNPAEKNGHVRCPRAGQDRSVRAITWLSASPHTWGEADRAASGR